MILAQAVREFCGNCCMLMSVHMLEKVGGQGLREECGMSLNHFYTMFSENALKRKYSQPHVLVLL